MIYSAIYRQGYILKRLTVEISPLAYYIPPLIQGLRVYPFMLMHFGIRLVVRELNPFTVYRYTTPIDLSFYIGVSYINFVLVFYFAYTKDTDILYISPPFHSRHVSVSSTFFKFPLASAVSVHLIARYGFVLLPLFTFIDIVPYTR